MSVLPDTTTLQDLEASVAAGASAATEASRSWSVVVSGSTDIGHLWSAHAGPHANSTTASCQERAAPRSGGRQPIAEVATRGRTTGEGVETTGQPSNTRHPTVTCPDSLTA